MHGCDAIAAAAAAVVEGKHDTLPQGVRRDTPHIPRAVWLFRRRRQCYLAGAHVVPVLVNIHVLLLAGAHQRRPHRRQPRRASAERRRPGPAQASGHDAAGRRLDGVGRRLDGAGRRLETETEELHDTGQDARYMATGQR